jgi:hypothetical protein
MIVGVSKLFNFSHLQYTTNITWDESATVRVCAMYITSAQCEHRSSHGTHLLPGDSASLHYGDSRA